MSSFAQEPFKHIFTQSVRRQRRADSENTAPAALSLTYKPMFSHKPEQFHLRLCITPARSSVVHACTCPHMEQWLLNIVSLVASHQQPNPQKIVLKAIKMLVRTYCLDRRFFVHHARMVKRVPLFGKLNNLIISLRHRPLAVGNLRCLCKFHDRA